MSVQHRLRHLSLTSFSSSSSALDLDLLVAELSGADSGIASAALVSIHLNCSLFAASRSALLLLPNLTRLDWSNDSVIRENSLPTQQQPPPPRSPPSPSPLERLHLGFMDDAGVEDLLQQAALRAPRLSELRLGRLPSSFRQLIGRLRSLRVLNIALVDATSPSGKSMQSLATLPLFSELVARGYLSVLQPMTFKITLETLRCIAESRSWRLIRQIGWLVPPQLALPTDVDAQLAERLADFRVLVEWRGRTTSHRLVIGAGGTVAWRQTEM
jgi:hypothetical protein